MRFAIAGTGVIARSFAKAVAKLEGSEVVAVLSREPSRADAFAAEFGVKRGYTDIEAMLSAPDVDALYVGTPNHLHLEQSLAGLRHGKHVLCEKSAYGSERDAREAVNCAREHGVLLMEALWSRTMPAYRRAKAWLDEGRVGKLRSISASFCFHAAYNPESRLYAPALGGGALLDVGVYAMGFALGMAGRAADGAQGVLHICPTGADDYDAILLRFGEVIATLNAGVSVQQRGEAYLYGEAGSIYVPAFWGAHHCELRDERGNAVEVFDDPETENLYPEAAHFVDCAQKGLPESPLMPHADTIELGRLYDWLRDHALKAR